MDKATSAGFFSIASAFIVTSAQTVGRPFGSRSKERLVNELLDELYRIPEGATEEKIRETTAQREYFRRATKLDQNSRRTLKIQIAGQRRKSRNS